MAAAGSRHSRQLEEPFTLGEIGVVLGDDGSARLPESGRLAGSTLTPFHGVLMACSMSNLPLSHIWDSFSVRPAQLLGFRHGLEVGNSADFCLFDLQENKLWATYHRGKAEYENDI
jgi:N-acetylglucosamine-6-phosphate deacetylase